MCNHQSLGERESGEWSQFSSFFTLCGFKGPLNFVRSCTLQTSGPFARLLSALGLVGKGVRSKVAPPGAAVFPPPLFLLLFPTSPNFCLFSPLTWIQIFHIIRKVFLISCEPWKTFSRTMTVNIMVQAPHLLINTNYLTCFFK